MKHKIGIFGTGYVGLVTGTCFASKGNQVICCDIDKQKIENLKKGIVPIYEPGLEELVIRNIKENTIKFTTSAETTIKDSDIIFIAVGTPMGEDGSADLSYVENVARKIGEVIKTDYHKHKIIVNKSTVPIGTAEKVQNIIESYVATTCFSVVSNPEFLKEGTAINDFMYPDRVVIGSDYETIRNIMVSLYLPFVGGDKNKILLMSNKSAEITKYAANSMLATRISFMNEIANLCDVVGANINDVKNGIGTDSRIGNKFLYAGVGYGGSCFPKDVRAFIKTAKNFNQDFSLLRSVEYVNENQKRILARKICKLFDNRTENINVVIWGLAFKGKTDDVRESAAIETINYLSPDNHFFKTHLHDPIASNNMKKIISPSKQIIYYDNQYDMFIPDNKIDVLMILADWDEYREIDFNKLKVMRNKIIMDGKNMLNKREVEEQGFKYYGIGVN